MPNSMFEVHFILVDFRWGVTIHGLVGDSPGDGGGRLDHYGSYVKSTFSSTGTELANWN